MKIVISLKVFPDYFLTDDSHQFIQHGDIKIIGDTHVASVFHNTLRQIEIDWQDLLANVVGDHLAFRFSQGASHIKDFMQRTKNNVQLDVRDYLQDSLQIAVTKEEVDEFIRNVDSLRADVDRIEARINRLDTLA